MDVGRLSTSPTRLRLAGLRSLSSATLIHPWMSHFQDFVDHYEEKYEKEYGKYQLARIVSVVNNFIDCGDYINGVARIRCVNPNCGFDYFVPFSHWCGLRLQRLLPVSILLTKTHSSFLREYGE